MTRLRLTICVGGTTVDDADRAQNDIEMVLAVALSSPWAMLKAKGICYNCENKTSPDLLFCDRDCRDDFEKRKAAQALLGRGIA